jgi:small-conductance mechanosensitive channel
VNTLVAQPWFWPAAAVVVGLPIVLLILHELHAALLQRGSAYAKPVALMRNWVFPACAVYLLIQQLEDTDADPTWSKVTATVFGFLIMMLLLSGANAAVFGEARTGSWRDRLPAIFVDLGRLILIVIGIGLLLSWVWGADIGGLITAVGVTSIVIGLAVQSAVGPVISGLLLLFEQPFRIGDWLDTKFGRGRVVEVNWRAVHIDTENGLQVVPNAALAGDAFVNLSRTTAPYFKAKATLTFGADDPPGEVKAALLALAESLPAKLPGIPAAAVALGGASYRVSVPIASPADEGAAITQLQHRAWYAAQRRGLHLNGAKANRKEHRAFVADHVEQIGASLGLDPESVTAMLAGARLLLFAEGEIVQSVYSVPDSVGFIVEGAVLMFVDTADGRRLTLGDLGAGDHIGGTALTRQRMITGVAAVIDTTIIAVSRDAMNAIVQRDHRLARRIGEEIEMRRRAAREALAEAAEGVR